MQKPTIPSMLRRCNNWDYSSPAIYMITLTLSDRSLPLLGKVVIDVQSNNPEQVQAHLEPSALGNEIYQIWRQLSECYPEVSPLRLQLMEEHLHFILQVVRKMQIPLGRIVAGFKARCTQVYRAMNQSQSSLFSPGFQDTILFHKGQLNRMFDYLRDNPRRLAIKRLFPDLFKIMRQIPFCDGFLTGIGNPFLLQRPNLMQIQASRQASTADIEGTKQKMLGLPKWGSAIVSPCISPGEKELARFAYQERLPLIALKNNGFPELYKPSGEYFDACAEGRLLLLVPPGFGYKPGRRKLTRDEACVLNRIAQVISGNGAMDIHYSGYVPQNLEELFRQAILPPR